MLAVVRKSIILDLTRTYALELFGFAAAILGLGGVYWLARDQEPRQRVWSVAPAAASSARRSSPTTEEVP